LRTACSPLPRTFWILNENSFGRTRPPSAYMVHVCAGKEEGL
jgi:hypothetical protein